MEELIYNVLWIDDEHENLDGFIGRASVNGINLVPFKSLNGGMEELEKNFPFYDGVLLDAQIFENEDDEKGTESTKFVHRAKERLLQINKKFEVFVLTGQARAFENDTFKEAFNNVYQKGRNSDTERLFLAIKQAAKNQEDTQLRHKYKRVFEVCTEKYLGEFAGQDILTLLKADSHFELNNQFSTIRKVVEDVLLAFNKFNLLPSEFVAFGIAFAESSRFLAGKGRDGISFTEKGYQHGEETHLPVVIASTLRNILSVIQPGSHRSEIDAYVKKMNTDYLFQSVLFQLMDVIVWFKMHVDSKPKTSNWTKQETSLDSQAALPELVKGKVIQLNLAKGFAFLKPESEGSNVFIPAHLVSNHELQNGMIINAEVGEQMDNRLNELRKIVRSIQL
jgi:hypothetical protein